MTVRSYSELITLPTFEERFEYLRLNGKVGSDTFGFDRYLNQVFYRSKEWKHIRNQVILRDNGCDLAIPDRQLFDKIYIHHMNPILPDDVINRTSYLMNPEYLVCVSFDTHNAIHYGDASLLPKTNITVRSPNDTAPWRLNNAI